MSKNPRIIGLAGTNGSGKDLVGELLRDRYNFAFISFSADFRAECDRRGIPSIRENTRMISAEWRRKYGLAVMVDRALKHFAKQNGDFAGVVIANLRNPYEADRVHELGGTVLWIDADAHVRYDRVRKNLSSRDRADDQRTFEQFMQDEADEMHPPKDGDAASLNMVAVKDRADLTIINESSIDDLQTQLVKKLGL